MAASGAYTKAEILKKLSALGLRSRKGKRE
jgi:hypothetical protein